MFVCMFVCMLVCTYLHMYLCVCVCVYPRVLLCAYQLQLSVPSLRLAWMTSCVFPFRLSSAKHSAHQFIHFFFRIVFNIKHKSLPSSHGRFAQVTLALLVAPRCEFLAKTQVSHNKNVLLHIANAPVVGLSGLRAVHALSSSPVRLFQLRSKPIQTHQTYVVETIWSM